MSISSLSAALLLPPLNLMPLGVAGLVLSLRRAPILRRLGRLAIGLALCGLFVLSLPDVAALLIRSLEIGLPQGDVPGPTSGSASASPAAVVILSGDAAFGGIGGIEPGSGIGPMTLDRMRAGAVLARRTGLPILVTGGRLDRDAEPIASQMARSLQDDFGIATRWVEPKAEDTWENAMFSARLLHADGISSAYVVTDAWHMKRALMAFARAGITAIPAPIRFDRPPEFELDELVPHISALQASYYAVHEWIGCAYYALRG